jgi:hypothetical protein
VRNSPKVRSERNGSTPRRTEPLDNFPNTRDHISGLITNRKGDVGCNIVGVVPCSARDDVRPGEVVLVIKEFGDAFFDPSRFHAVPATVAGENGWRIDDVGASLVGETQRIEWIAREPTNPQQYIDIVAIINSPDDGSLLKAASAVAENAKVAR